MTTTAALPVLEAATAPPPVRDGVRLLVATPDGLSTTAFTALPHFLRRGDLLVVNDSATLPAALPAVGPEGEPLALHLSTPVPHGAPGEWLVAVRRPVQLAPPTPGCVASGAKTPRLRHTPGLGASSPLPGRDWSGVTLQLPAGASAHLRNGFPRSGARLQVAELRLSQPLLAYLARHGSPIRYPYTAAAWPLRAYQTIFAKHPGSAEMPSAGRPFTRRVLADLHAAGVNVAAITLHTGVASLEADEDPYPERYHVPASTVRAVRAAQRVIAVGTTVVRALESAADRHGRVTPASGWTDVVITPERGVRVVDGLLTGWHEPAATHRWMLEAVAGSALIAASYEAAAHAGYRWHEFGDSHLLLP